MIDGVIDKRNGRISLAHGPQLPYYPMHSPRLYAVLLDHIQGLGYHVGRVCYCDIRLGCPMVCLDDRAFIVRAPVEREYDGLIELCRVVGIDLMDG